VPYISPPDRRERPGLGRRRQRKRGDRRLLARCQSRTQARPTTASRPAFGWRWPASCANCTRPQRSGLSGDNKEPWLAAQNAPTGFALERKPEELRLRVTAADKATRPRRHGCSNARARSKQLDRFKRPASTAAPGYLLRDAPDPPAHRLPASRSSELLGRFRAEILASRGLPNG